MHDALPAVTAELPQRIRSCWQMGTALLTRGGHRLTLRGMLPQQVGQVVEVRPTGVNVIEPHRAPRRRS